MKRRLVRALILSGMGVLAGCMSAPDHFYMLNTLPGATHTPVGAGARPVRLSVTIPSMVDRSEMVLNDPSDAVLVYEHERWAAPLADEVSATLARDLEQRRTDFLIGDARFDRLGTVPLAITVDIVRMSARRGGPTTLEAHWRIVGAGPHGADQLGGNSFSADANGSGFAAIAQSYSQALSELADAIAADVPHE